MDGILKLKPAAKTGSREMNAMAVIDDSLLEWLKNNPDVIKELRIRSGLD